MKNISRLRYSSLFQTFFSSQVSVIMLVVLAHSKNTNSQHQRSPPEYSYRPVAAGAGRQYSQESAVPPLYSKSLQAVLAKSGPTLQQEYVGQPAAPGLSQSQQYYTDNAEQQAVSYTQPSENKYVSSAAGAGAVPSAGLQKVRHFLANLLTKCGGDILQ